jgi:hypothetical protein
MVDGGGGGSPEDTQPRPSNKYYKTHNCVLIIVTLQSCQSYLRALASSIPPPSALPTGTHIAIVGCGAPSLIQMYAEAAGCLHPIYTDPTRRLYDILGMTRTLSTGNHNPQYIRESLVASAAKGIMQCLKRIPQGDAFDSGDIKQVGGEFLFETVENPGQDHHDDMASETSDSRVAVTWCHRMANTKDHSEVAVIRRILQLDPVGSDQKGPSQSAE